MKVALVKQILDFHGPWSGVSWHRTHPGKMLEEWPAKVTYWGMTCLLKADWFVTPQIRDTDFTHWSVLKQPGRAGIFHKHAGSPVRPEDIPFEAYDLVISFDPFLRPPKNSRTLFAYFLNEDADSLYRPSLRRPVSGYDLFLAHMMDAGDGLRGLPQAVNFPYAQDPRAAAIFSAKKDEDAVWADWRTLVLLGMEELHRWTGAAEKAAARLEELLEMPVFFNGNFSRTAFHVTDPPAWGSPARYMESLGRCRYYISVGREGGAGQGVCDAASLDCICIGDRHKHVRAYHRLICHPECLCSDLAEMPRRLRRVMRSADLRAEVLAWQRDALERHFVKKPLALLGQALEMKRRNGRS